MIEATVAAYGGIDILAILVRCLTGQAGSGKTRLGIELCEKAEAAEWQAGFLRHADLQQNLTGWRWNTNTLLVVDYAAAAAPALKTWLEALATRPLGDPKLRILLLERYAEPERGWWDLAFAGRGINGSGADSLLDPPQLVPVAPLVSDEDRRALLTEVMALASSMAGRSPALTAPVPGEDADFDRRLREDADTREPVHR